MRPLVCLALAALAATSTSASVPRKSQNTRSPVSSLRTIRPPAHPPLGWRRGGGSVDADTVATFTITLAETNAQELARIALAVSTPGHAEYGKFLDQAAIDALTAPPPGALGAVIAWLRAEGVVPATVERGRVVRVACSAAQTERLLSTTLEHWTHRAHPALELVRAGAFTLPARVAPHIDAVFGLHGVPWPKEDATASLKKSLEKLTPAILEDIYNVTKASAADTAAARGAGFAQSFVEFGGVTCGEDDAKSFFAHMMPAGSYEVGVDDVFDASRGGTGRPEAEANLDMQYVMTLSPGSPTQLWYFPTNDLCGSFKDFLSELLAANATAARLVPSVHSISYGIQGNVTGLGCTVDQIASTDADFAKAAARGFTIIIASGDSGAAVDSGNCMGGPIQNNTQLHGTTSAEHQLIDSYVV